MNISKNNNFKKQKGLTLIEVLITTVIIGIMGAGLLTLQFIIGKNQTSVITNYMSIDEANSRVSEFTKEIRGARASATAAYALEVVDDNEIIFYSDIDFDDEVEKVRYTLTDNELEKGVIEPVGYPPSYLEDDEKAWIVSTNVRNAGVAAFYYYNGDWPDDQVNNPLVQNQRLSDTRTIGIYIRLNQKDDDPGGDYVLESHGQIRMLKENL